MFEDNFSFDVLFKGTKCYNKKCGHKIVKNLTFKCDYMEVEKMTTVQVCIGSACHLKGSYNVINKLQNVLKERKLDNEITVKAAFCLGECTKAVSVKVNDGVVQSLDESGVESFLDKLLVGGTV